VVVSLRLIFCFAGVCRALLCLSVWQVLGALVAGVAVRQICRCALVCVAVGVCALWCCLCCCVAGFALCGAAGVRWVLCCGCFWGGVLWRCGAL